MLAKLYKEVTKVLSVLYMETVGFRELNGVTGAPNKHCVEAFDHVRMASRQPP